MAFRPNGQRFNEVDYYRDDEFARLVLQCAAVNPVVVSGLRRNGKTWLLSRSVQLCGRNKLRRFDGDGSPVIEPFNSPLAPEARLIDGSGRRDATDQYANRLEVLLVHRTGPPLFIDEVEKLLADPHCSELVQGICEYRGPLVMTASPAIDTLVQQCSPRIEKFFTEECQRRILKPLTPPERRALVSQSCDPSHGLADEQLELALHRSWGGHPLVLQQACELIREEKIVRPSRLRERLNTALNLLGPRYGYSLVETGLTPLQREALLELVGGGSAVVSFPSRLTEAARQLEAHGAIRRTRTHYRIENVVLEQYIKNCVCAQVEHEQGGHELSRPNAYPKRQGESQEDLRLQAPSRPRSGCEPTGMGLVFISSTSADRLHLEQMTHHLAPLWRQIGFEAWDRSHLLPGQDRAFIVKQLERASIILLLVSAPYLNSEEYAADIAMALLRRGQGATVVPIYLRPVEVLGELAAIEGLPRQRKPVIRFRNRDEAWQNVSAGLARLLSKPG